MPQQTFTRAAQAALLTWVNTFPLDRKVERLEDLADGYVFAQMLHDLDPEYDPSELDQNIGSSAWLTKKRNIQSVFKALTKYIIHKDTSGAIDFLPRTVDFRAISDNLDHDGISQLISVFAAATMLGDHNTKYIPIMGEGLSTKEQAEIMAILQHKDEERQKLAGNAMDDSLGEVTHMVDPALEAEAELATLAADHDKLSKRLADSNTRLEHLQISYEQLKDELERTQHELESQRHKHGANESQMIKGLYDKIREQDELISSQEGQAEDDRQAKQRLIQENLQLSKKAELVQQLQDEVQELKHANEELRKKANTVDRYKQKIEAQRGVETQLQNTMYELSQTKETLREYESLQSKYAAQLTSIEKFRTMVETLEQQLEANRLQRHALEQDVYSAQQQLNGFKEQKLLDEARIAELEQQVLQGTGAASSATPDGTKTTFNLEEELEHTANPAAAYSLEISRLRAENNLLRSNTGAGSENDRLRAELETAKKNAELWRTKYSTAYEQAVVKDAELQASVENPADDTSPAWVNMQKSLQELRVDLDNQTKETQELKTQLADKDREVVGLQADLNAVEKESTQALQGLKAADELISEDLKKELDALRKAHAELQAVSEQHRNQLVDALLSKDNLRKELDTAAKRTALATKAGEDGASAGDSKEVIEQLRVELVKANERIEKLVSHHSKQKKLLEKAEQEKYDLQRRLKAAEQGGAAAAQKAASDQIIKNLQRENAMISTAWHDLTSRLQSNHVVLQRRQDMPKSWLNKQRQMVNATPRR